MLVPSVKTDHEDSDLEAPDLELSLVIAFSSMLDEIKEVDALVVKGHSVQPLPSQCWRLPRWLAVNAIQCETSLEGPVVRSKKPSAEINRGKTRT